MWKAAAGSFVVALMVVLAASSVQAQPASGGKGTCEEVFNGPDGPVERGVVCHAWAQDLADKDVAGLESDFRFWAWAAFVLLALVGAALTLAAFFKPRWHFIFPKKPILRWVAPAAGGFVVSWLFAWGLLAVDLPNRVDSRLGPGSKRVTNLADFWDDCSVCRDKGTDLTRKLLGEIEETAGSPQDVSPKTIVKMFESTLFPAPVSWPPLQAGLCALVGLVLAVVGRVVIVRWLLRAR